MQSSPPTRAWQRPTSPTESQYSIDLAALDGESRSGASSPALPTQHVDRVLSEDIDGPSDFTQNLEGWMRGGTLNKKGTLKGGLHSLKEARETEQELDKLAIPEHNAAQEDEDHSASHHTPIDSPPKESVFEDSRHGRGNEEGSSDWDPYVEGATPQPPPHQHLLQPSVEDYYSELTPARPASLPTSRIPSRGYMSSTQPPQGILARSEPSTPGRPSSETISPVRSPVFQRSMPKTNEATFRQLQELREKCQHLEHLNASLNAAIDDEKRFRRQDREMYEAKLTDASRRESHLSELRNQAYEHKEDLRREVGELKERLHKQESETNKLRQSRDAKMDDGKQQADRERMEHVQEVRALEQDLELARRSRDDAEEMARVAKDDLEEYRAARDANTRRDDDLRSRLSELQDQLRSLTSENNTLKLAKKSADETVNNVRAELSLLKQTQQEDTTRLAGDHRRAVTLAENLQSQLKELRQKQRDRQTAHDAEIASINAAKQAAVSVSNSEDESMMQTVRAELTVSQTKLNTLTCQLDKKQTALNTAILERDAYQDELSALKADLEAAKLDLNDRDAVNKALDVKMSDAWKKREAYWRERLEDAEKERKIMVKALLRQWGREEVGIADEKNGELQRFRYKFVNGGEERATEVKTPKVKPAMAGVPREAVEKKPAIKGQHTKLGATNVGADKENANNLAARKSSAKKAVTGRKISFDVNA
jgi:hypothetical protein